MTTWDNWDVRRDDDTIVFISNNIHIKQLVWAWADSSLFPERYGRQTGPYRGDRTTWEWKFTSEQARSLVHDLSSMALMGIHSHANEKHATTIVVRALLKGLPEDER